VPHINKCGLRISTEMNKLEKDNNCHQEVGKEMSNLYE
jgi:hypothetical protein